MVIISIGKLFRVDETDSGNRLPKTKREKERKSKRERERERDSVSSKLESFFQSEFLFSN